MLVPLVGFVLACVIFASLGAALLALMPKLRPTLMNVGLFVLGAVPSALVGVIAYGRLFGNDEGELHSAGAVLGVFPVLFLAGVCGGLLTLVVSTRLARFSHSQRDSGRSIPH
jgi:hypothetical protein